MNWGSSVATGRQPWLPWLPWSSWDGPSGDGQLEVPIPYLRPKMFRPKFQGISPENIVKTMVITNVPPWLRILKISHWFSEIPWRFPLRLTTFCLQLRWQPLPPSAALREHSAWPCDWPNWVSLKTLGYAQIAILNGKRCPKIASNNNFKWNNNA